MPLSYMNYKLQTVFVLLFFHPEEPARSLRFYCHIFFYFSIYTMLYGDRSILLSKNNRDYDSLHIYMYLYTCTYVSFLYIRECIFRNNFIKNRLVFDSFINY